MTENKVDIFSLSKQVLAQADCLYTQAEVDQALDKLAQQITKTIGNSHPVVLAVMNGGLIPCGMLLPRLDFPLQQDYIHATRYCDDIKPGEIHWIAHPSINLADRTVLLIDDIHDEGTTLQKIAAYCEQQEAKKVYTCVLTHKQHQRKTFPAADFTGLEVPDRYIFGYGMDYKTLLRNAPGIYAVRGT